jgi:hypothetical protein
LHARTVGAAVDDRRRRHTAIQIAHNGQIQSLFATVDNFLGLFEAHGVVAVGVVNSGDYVSLLQRVSVGGQLIARFR